MNSISRAVVVTVVLLAPALAFAQYNPLNPTYTQQSSLFFSGGVVGTSGFGSCVGGTIVCAAQTVLFIINGVLVPVLFAIAFIVFLYGIARAYIFSYGDPERVKEGHRLLLWGLVAFAVMISVWGLVNVVANTFGLNGSYAPPTPVSFPVTGGAGYGQPGTTYIERPPSEMPAAGTQTQDQTLFAPST